MLQYSKEENIMVIVPIIGIILTAIFVPNQPLLLAHIIGLTFVCIGIVVVNSKKTRFLK